MRGMDVAPRSLQRRPVLVVVAAVGVAAVTTAIVVLVDVRARHEGQLGIDAAAATVGSLVSYLLFGRFRESRQVRDLLLCGFLLVLGASNAVFAAIPRSFGSAA